MTQRELDREVAQATGESLSHVRRLGFSILIAPEAPPQTVDWDALDEERLGLYPARAGD